MVAAVEVVEVAKANPIAPPLPAITIRNDGNVESSIYPPPITKTGNTYTLTSNITNYRLSIQCSNITVDGAGYTLEGIKYSAVSGITIEANGVTIKNFNIGFYDWAGINVTGSYNTIIGNNIAEPLNFGVYLEGSYNNITRNILFASNYGVWLSNSALNNSIVENTLNRIGCLGNYNKFYLNNFVDSSGIIVYLPQGYTQGNVFDNGSMGNYWSNYNGTDVNGDGIGDMPYTISENPADANITDYYPLMSPINISTSSNPSPSTSPSNYPSPTSTPSSAPSPQAPTSSPSLNASPSPTQQPTIESSPTAKQTPIIDDFGPFLFLSSLPLIMVAVIFVLIAIVSICVLVYFKKHYRKK